MKGATRSDESAVPLSFTELYSEFQFIVLLKTSLFWFPLTALKVSFSATAGSCSQ